MQNAEKKLKVLSRVFYIVGLLCIPVSFVAPWAIMHRIKIDPPPFPIPAILTVVAILTLLASLAMSICVLVAARSIAEHRRRVFCIGISGLLCLSVPVGTGIGIWAIILLNDPAIREMFAASSPLRR
jgi:hypothetical protein